MSVPRMIVQLFRPTESAHLGYAQKVVAIGPKTVPRSADQGRQRLDHCVRANDQGLCYGLEFHV